MRHLKTFEDFNISESSNTPKTFKGKEIYPNHLSSKHFGKVIKNKLALHPGHTYFIFEPGLEAWQGDYEFSMDKGKYFFKDTIQFGENDQWFEEEEIETLIKDGDIIEQNELGDEDLEDQTVPTHVCIKSWMDKDIDGDPTPMIRMTDLVYVDKVGERLIIINGFNKGLIVDYTPSQLKEYLLSVESPKGKEFLHANRGRMNGKKFGF